MDDGFFLCREYVRERVVSTMGLKHTGQRCEGGGARGRCRGRLRDTVLDWEDELPVEEMERAEHHARSAIASGTGTRADCTYTS